MSQKINYTKLPKTSADESKQLSLSALWKEYLAFVSCIIPKSAIRILESRKKLFTTLAVVAAMELLLVFLLKKYILSI